MKLKIYLAAPFARGPIAEWCAGHIEDAGHEVVSRWHSLPAGADLSDPASMAEAAERDLADLLAADLLVCLTEEPNKSQYSSGGRHVEAGIMMGLMLALEARAGAVAKPRIMVVGPLENVYYATRHAWRVPSWKEAIEWIRAEASR